MRVSDLMSRDVVTIAESASCYDAVMRMKTSRVRHLPVVAEEGHLRGIVTDRDLRHHLFTPGVFDRIGSISTQTILKAFPVREIMSAPVVSVGPASDLEQAARLMREYKIGSLPVVDAGRVVGILTETDLLHHIVCEDERCSPEVEFIVVSYP